MVDFEPLIPVAAGVASDLASMGGGKRPNEINNPQPATKKSKGPWKHKGKTYTNYQDYAIAVANDASLDTGVDVAGRAVIPGETGDSKTAAAKSKTGSNSAASPDTQIASKKIASAKPPTPKPVTYDPIKAATVATSEVRPEQLAIIEHLKNVQAGKTPSVAQQQLNMARESNIAAALSASNSARGGGTVAGQRAAMQQGAAINQQAAREAALLRAQEQAAATGQLAGVVGDVRTSDEAINALNVSNMMAADKSNLDARLKAGEINTNAMLDAHRLWQDGKIAEASALLGIDRLTLDKLMNDADIAIRSRQLDIQQAGQDKTFWSSILGGVGTALPFLGKAVDWFNTDTPKTTSTGGSATGDSHTVVRPSGGASASTSVRARPPIS